MKSFIQTNSYQDLESLQLGNLVVFLIIDLVKHRQMTRQVNSGFF